MVFQTLQPIGAKKRTSNLSHEVGFHIAIQIAHQLQKDVKSEWNSKRQTFCLKVFVVPELSVTATSISDLANTSELRDITPLLERLVRSATQEKVVPERKGFLFNFCKRRGIFQISSRKMNPVWIEKVQKPENKRKRETSLVQKKTHNSSFWNFLNLREKLASV